MPIAGVADHRDELAALLGHGALPRLADEPQLALAADEARLRAIAPAPRAPRPAGAPATGSALPFSSSGSTGSTSTAPRTSSSVASPISTSSGVGRLLQPGGDVDRVAGREPLLGAGHDLAGVHADPSLDAELRECLAHLHRRPAGAQRIVLVHRRHAEHGHDRVADELLHRSAVRLDDRLHPLEVAGQQRPAAPPGRPTRRARSSRPRRRTAR